jgi:hypothetical protein
MKQQPPPPAAPETPPVAPAEERLKAANTRVPETGGPTGPEPTRYGDWERGGRCVDF